MAMFYAFGVAVQRNGAAYDVTVDYFDDRVEPPKLVTRLTHNATTGLELENMIQNQLAAMKSSDMLDALTTQIVGKVLATIDE